MLGGAELT